MRMESAPLRREKRNNKSRIDSPAANKSNIVPQQTDDVEAGLPLFLQQHVISLSALPPPIQLKGDQEDTRDMARFNTAASLRACIDPVPNQGRSLPKSLKSFFEPRLSHDFNDVRLHTDDHSNEAARKVNAKAFTIGRDIYFNSGQYSPETNPGRQLLAHELSHVIQQGRAAPICPEVGESSEETVGHQSNRASGVIKTNQHQRTYLKSEPRVQRLWWLTGCASPSPPRAVQNGPRYRPVNDRTRGVAGMEIDITIIPGHGENSDLNQYVDEERVSDSSGHWGSMRGRRPLQLNQGGEQNAANIPPDHHEIPHALIFERVDQHGGDGGFSYHQLDVYREQSGITWQVIENSGYRVDFSFRGSSGRPIILTVVKRPVACTIGSFTAQPGENESGALNPTYTVLIFPRGTISAFSRAPERQTSEDTREHRNARRHTTDAGAVDSELPDAGVPGGIQETDPMAPSPESITPGPTRFHHNAAIS